MGALLRGASGVRLFHRAADRLSQKRRLHPHPGLGRPAFLRPQGRGAAGLVPGEEGSCSQGCTKRIREVEIMILTEIFQGTEALSVFDKIAQLLWSDIFTLKDFFEFILAAAGFVTLILGPCRWIRNSIVKISAPYKAYREDIDAVLGRNSRKLIEKYYIPTRGQDVDPCNEEEIRENNGKYNTEELIPFLCKKAFSENSFGKHYIVLADSGMGKTTLLVNLYRHYVLNNNTWTKNRKKMRFIPLSSENCIEQIKEIKNPGMTILLLDALDECKEAMLDSEAFMKKLLVHTEKFCKIVITCRTHFFQDEKDEPENTGMIRAGTGNKNLKFTKKYITPFSDHEVDIYLRKRFRFQPATRRKAKKIVNKVPAIMARPLILNWIDCLVEPHKKLEYSYQIYETIIDRWIKREPESLTKGKLLALSVRIADWMADHTTTHIPASVVEEMAHAEKIELLPIVAKSRSLLNRNSTGEYKFAHRSFLEYFLATKTYVGATIPENDTFLHAMSGFRRFFDEYVQYSLFINSNPVTFQNMCKSFIAAQNECSFENIELVDAFGSDSIRVYTVKEFSALSITKGLHVKIVFIPKKALIVASNRTAIPCIATSFVIDAHSSENNLLIGCKGFYISKDALNSSMTLSNDIDASTNVYHAGWDFLPDVWMSR